MPDGWCDIVLLALNLTQALGVAWITRDRIQAREPVRDRRRNGG